MSPNGLTGKQRYDRGFRPRRRRSGIFKNDSGLGELVDRVRLTIRVPVNPQVICAQRVYQVDEHVGRLGQNSRLIATAAAGCSHRAEYQRE
jgi:hypothetical protein